MATANRPAKELLAENEDLRLRLEEAEETLRAIGSGEVDAFVVSGPDGPQVFTLKGAEQPYRVLVETMNEGAATLTPDGTILYCNGRLAAMLQVPLENIIGTRLSSYVVPADQPLFAARLARCTDECDKDEITMITGAGNPVPVLISCCALDLSGSRQVSLVVTDLTQQKRNEEIVASERLARSIIEQAGEAILVCDEVGRIIRASKPAHQLSGGNPLLMQFNELFQLRIIETDCLFTVLTPLHGGRLESVEVELNRSDGEIFHLLLNATPLKSDQNGIIGCVVMLTDITERKEAEEELRQSEGRLQSAYHELQVTNEELQVQSEELQAQSEEIQAQSEEIQAQSEELQVQNQELEQLWDVSKRAEEALIKLNEELENRVAERTAELADFVEKLQVEIDERKNAQESVLRLNRLYAVLSETNQAIVRTRNRDTIFNDFCRIAVEDGGFQLAWVGLVEEEGGELKIVAAKGATGYLEEIRITAKEEPVGLGPTGISVRNGSYYICNDFLGSPVTRPWHERGRAHGIRASASIALKQEGQVIGALTLYAEKKDFFDQQQIELLMQMGTDVSFALDNIVRETRRQNAEQALSEETAEKLRAVEALREKEQLLIQQSRQAAMGEMIGNIAHQWRQPLNALGLIIQQTVLFYDLGELSSEVLNKNASQSRELIKHMSQTIDDFRNYFRPDKEKVQFNLSESIADTLSLINASFKNQDIDIELIVKNDSVIYGYRNEYAQVLLNILNNARDVLTERGTVDPRVTITIGSDGGRAIVTIADNAGGISEEIMDKIFDPYFTTKGPQLGTGLGLFMSKSIIEKNMGGRLSVCNIAHGAEFRIEV
jgi:PAS domain S-box-containing protein